MRYILLAFMVWSGSALAAVDCASEQEKTLASFRSAYRTEALRAVLMKVRGAASQMETTQLLTLSQRFNSIPHDTPAHQEERFALQNQARTLTRTLVSRAGYRLLNPAQNSPFDAVIEERQSDGILTSITEVRSLLIERDPLPHLTYWTPRTDPRSNPLRIVSVGVQANPAMDYVSWYPENSGRISAPLHEFVKTLLPADCR